jgi:hypothetical protein
MYIGMLIVLMLIFPMASIALEVFVHNHGVFDVAIVGKWFVFWAVGMRLLTAGLRQIVQPRYTAETILGVKDPDAMLIVRELGFANTAIGSAGLGSLYLAGWVLPVAVIGAIFYGLAGINHVTHRSRNTLQNVAMTSDFFAAVVLLIFCLVTTAKWWT